MEGFIVLHRKMLEWEWFTDTNVLHLFITLLLKANYRTTKWRGISVPRGGLITSYESLAKTTGLSAKQVRTALDKLKKTGEVAHETTNNYSIITIVNWEKYQERGKPEGSQRAGGGQAEGRRRATDNKDNNLNKDNKYLFSGRIINLTQGDFEKFRQRGKSLSHDEVMAAIQRADDFFYAETLDGKTETKWFFRLGEWIEREEGDRSSPSKRSLGYTPLGVGG